MTLPLIAPGMLAGVLLSFMASFDEVGIAIFIKSSYLETLPTLMFSSMTRSTDPTIAAASTLVLLLTLTLIAVAALVLTNARRTVERRDDEQHWRRNADRSRFEAC